MRRNRILTVDSLQRKSFCKIISTPDVIVNCIVMKFHIYQTIIKSVIVNFALKTISCANRWVSNEKNYPPFRSYKLISNGITSFIKMDDKLHQRDNAKLWLRKFN